MLCSDCYWDQFSLDDTRHCKDYPKDKDIPNHCRCVLQPAVSLQSHVVPLGEQLMPITFSRHHLLSPSTDDRRGAPAPLSPRTNPLWTQRTCSFYEGRSGGAFRCPRRWFIDDATRHSCWNGSICISTTKASPPQLPNRRVLGVLPGAKVRQLCVSPSSVCYQGHAANFLIKAEEARTN